MELIPKQGYIFVEIIEELPADMKPLSDSMICGRVKSGIKEIGMVVFFEDYSMFDEEGYLLLVKVDDVLAWIKPEEKVYEQADNA